MTEKEVKNAELELAREKFEFEKQKAERESRFFYRNSATVITAIISLAAILVSTAQVWSAFINRQTEIEDAKQQKLRTDETAKRELDIRWKSDAMKFVSDNKKQIFEGSPAEKLALCGVIRTTFPADVADTLFVKFGGNSPEEQTFWGECRKRLDVDYAIAVATKVGGGPSPVTVEEEVDLRSIKELVEKFNGPERQTASMTLANLAREQEKDVVDTLIDGILPPDDPMSYRKNLYIALTLGLIAEGWHAPKDKYRRVEGLKQTDNFNDPTFKHQVQVALNNYKGS